jgi:hypothetical protein
MARLLGSSLINSSMAARSHDTGLALLLAIEGAKRTPGRLANQALYDALSEMRELAVLDACDGGRMHCAAASPDGRFAVTVSEAMRTRVFDLQSWSRVAEIPSVSSNASPLQPGRKWLAVGSKNGAVGSGARHVETRPRSATATRRTSRPRSARLEVAPGTAPTASRSPTSPAGTSA